MSHEGKEKKKKKLCAPLAMPAIAAEGNVDGIMTRISPPVIGTHECYCSPSFIHYVFIHSTNFLKHS